MKIRGKVLREPNGGPGLLMAQGQQYKFSLDGIWKSETAPKAGQDVELDLDQNLQILSITVISESQIAKEQAEAVAKVTGEKGKVLVGAAVAKFGLPTLVATGLLMIGWFFLAALSIQSPLGKIDFTFWQLLGFLNSSSAFEGALEGRNGPSAGFYGLLALVALAGPYVAYFWKDKRASLVAVLPLVFMIMVWFMLRSSINSSMGVDVSGPLGDVAKQAREEAMKAVSLGFGSYLSGLVSLYFAGVGTRKFLLAGALHTEVQGRSSQAAA